MPDGLRAAPSSADLRSTLSERVVIADGAMGTMLQGYDLTLEDFEQLEGCNEILNVTRPDIVRAIHDAYFDVGVDAVETNTFGANFSALSEYGIAARITELAEAGARIARESADAHSTPDRPRWVLGSVGPGTKLPTLGHVSYGRLRDAYQQQVEGLIAGGIDAVLIETSQDLLQTKAATLGAKRALAYAGRDLPVIVHVTVETTGTMLLGSEIGAASTALEPLGIDLIGLNCATGPAEMSEHLRHLSRHAQIGVSCMPNAGLPQLTADGAVYPLQPVELADAWNSLSASSDSAWWAAAVAPDRSICGRLSRAWRAGPSVPGHRVTSRRILLVRRRAVPPGHQLSVDRGTDQRQRVQGFPGGTAGRALGRLRGHRAIPDPRRRPHARSQYRLCRPGRRRRHARAGIPAGDGVDAARSCWTPPNRRCCKQAWNVSVDAR